MARISGVDIPNAKRVEVALTYIYGIGPQERERTSSQTTGINPDIQCIGSDRGRYRKAP